MSLNHYSTDLPDTFSWQQQQQHNMEGTQNTHSPNQQNPSWSTSHLYHHHQSWSSSMMFPSQNDDEELDHHHHQVQVEEVEKEAMFEKPLTPSDVGKLNRLVIPKQHAEKYFPLGGTGVDSSGDKGLLLSFEDESGKCWRFRYSYWNSSQSYVLTKGWSRYVKDKQLDAGDVVFFQRHRADAHRLFIGWRRRGAVAAAVQQADSSNTAAYSSGSGGGWSRGSVPINYHNSGHIHQGFIASNNTTAVPYQPDCLYAHAGANADAIVENQTAVPMANSKILRLFGVNLECQLDESEPSTPDGSPLSSQGPPHHHFHSEPNYMDITFSGDVNQMRNRRG